MFNLLKSDLYRIVKGKMFWVYAAICVLAMVGIAAMLSWITSPEFAQMVNDNSENPIVVEAEITPAEQTAILENEDLTIDNQEMLNNKILPSLTATWSDAYLDGGFLGLISTAFIAVFFGADIKSGFMKNLTLDRKGRRRYFAEKFLLIAIIQAFFLALVTIASTAAFTAYGFTYQVADTPTGIALWLLLAWLVTTAYACVIACILWIARSEWAAVASAILISSGIIGAFISQLASFLSTALPILSGVPYWLISVYQLTMPNGAVELLTQNPAFPFPALLPAGQTALTAVLWISVCVVLVFTYLQKRDVK